MRSPDSPYDLHSAPTSCPKLAITDATAALAWAETADESAGAWLCAKYRPLVLHIAARHFGGWQAQQEIADETLKQALRVIAAESPARPGMCFSRIAVQICRERSRQLAAGTQHSSLTA